MAPGSHGSGLNVGYFPVFPHLIFIHTCKQFLEVKWAEFSCKSVHDFFSVIIFILKLTRSRTFCSENQRNGIKLQPNPAGCFLFPLPAINKNEKRTILCVSSFIAFSEAALKVKTAKGQERSSALHVSMQAV